MKPKSIRERLYVGVDVGGTKIQASLVCESGVSWGSSGNRHPEPADRSWSCR